MQNTKQDSDLVSAFWTAQGRETRALAARLAGAPSFKPGLPHLGLLLCLPRFSAFWAKLGSRGFQIEG